MGRLRGFLSTCRRLVPRPAKAGIEAPDAPGSADMDGREPGRGSEDLPRRRMACRGRETARAGTRAQGRSDAEPRLAVALRDRV